MTKSPTVNSLKHDWHLQNQEQVAKHFTVEINAGLSEQQVQQAFDKYGENEIQDSRSKGPLLIFLRQFADFMIVVLMVAAVVSGVVGELADTIAILVILLLNASIGAVLEYRAEKSVAALKRMSPLSARILRQGEWCNLPAHELVPGDVVELSAGSVVPADIRLWETGDLEVDESVLTGESATVGKVTDTLSDAQLPLGDRNNMTYRGTLVSRGRAVGIVVATGMDTELGQIANLLRGEEGSRTPLQIRLSIFGQRLALVVLGICTLIFFAGLLRGESLTLMFLTAVSLAVAAIPEALPAVVTVSLALGAGKMVRQHALVRRLPAVESLGSITYICTDKTGTLTENRMRLEKIWTVSERADQLYGPDHGESDHLAPVWQHLGRALALNNELGEQAVTSSKALQGDPTEVALVEAAMQAGYQKTKLLNNFPQLGVLAFTSERQCMTTLHRDGSGSVAYVKGSPERVLALCHAQLAADGEQELAHDTLLAEAETLAETGYRVLALAYRQFDTVLEPKDIVSNGHCVEKNIEAKLTFLAFVCLIDPPRAEAADAVKDCLAAGITPVMITGDHPGTARAIARRLNIINKHNGAVLTGAELQKLSEAEFRGKVKTVRVYARMSPEQKISIVNALQQQGEFVAMTGDGVNDAPALKTATIGVSMGGKGSDVAREASDIVLLDDNFATIVSAVKEGRRIFDNIRKFINYTMSSNAGEIWTLLLAPFLGLPLPLLPIQILWINLVTDGLPGLALVAEKHEPDIMQRPPRPPEETVFSKGVWQHILWVGFLIGGLSIMSQAWAYRSGSEHWQTMVFSVLTFSQLVHALVIRSDRVSLWSLGLMSNPYLLGVVVLSVGLQLSVIYLPGLQTIFHTTALPPTELAVCFTLPLVVLLAVEIEKWLVRHRGLYGLMK